MDGILNINKAPGMSSHDVVARIRKLCHQRRVGHTGTLDPEASGVLPICLGQATRVAEYLSESGKAYQAEFTLGIITDTYDAEGQILETKSCSNITQEQIEHALRHFEGPQMQIPPRYSAIKIKGKPAYQLARAGTDVEMEPRAVTFYTLRFLSWESPHLHLEIECSKGTYIRSLAYDLGIKLGCGAHMSHLIRTRSGPFTLTDSLTLEEVSTLLEQEKLATRLFPADKAVSQYPALYVDQQTTERILHGNPFSLTEHGDISGSEQEANIEAKLARVYAPDKRFLALVAWDATHQRWQPKKVFA